MSDSVMIILILCITYLVGMVIIKWNPGLENKGKHQQTQRKDGAKQ